MQLFSTAPSETQTVDVANTIVVFVCLAGLRLVDCLHNQTQIRLRVVPHSTPWNSKDKPRTDGATNRPHACHPGNMEILES